MPDPRTPSSRRRVWLAAGAALVASTAAWAFPWDIDMVDAEFFRAYEWTMMQPPEGAVSRDNYVANYSRDTPEGQGLANPYAVNDATLATGERMFEVYCQTCHGEMGTGGAEVMRNEPDVGIRRFPVPAPMLSGAGSVSSGRTDGYIYLTIRNGGAVMPGYKQAMSDEEMWATVAYIRTLDSAAYVPPAPPAGEGE